MAATLADIQVKAARDAGFRAALLRNPYATLAAEGVEVPAHVMVTVVEATPDHLVLVLPPPDDDGELGEDALAGATGGTWGLVTWLCPRPG